MDGHADLDAVDRDALERCMEIAQRDPLRRAITEKLEVTHGSRSQNLPATIAKSTR